MSGPATENQRVQAPAKAAVDPLIATSEVPDSVRRVTRQLEEFESRVLRNGWVIYAVDLLGPDVAVRPRQDDDGDEDTCLTACAVWEISEGGYRWVRPIVEELGRRYQQIDFEYLPEKGTLWASRSLGSAEISTEQILEAMWQLTDACVEAWQRVAALGLGKRFHSAWLSEESMDGERTLAELRRERAGAAEPGAAAAA